MTTHDDFAATAPVADVLERLGVRYYIGGSVASSMHGVGRSTMDVDIVAQLQSAHVDPFVASLEKDYYVDAHMIRTAIQRRSSFNLIHFITQHKIDVFVSKDRPFDRAGWSRLSSGVAFEGGDREFPLASAEDVILNKLEWYRLGDEMSERQWNDVLGVIRVQGDALDRDYLNRWATQLGVSDLLDRAMREAE